MELLHEKDEFSVVYRIMETSFPSCERRIYKNQYDLLFDPDYNIYIKRDSEQNIIAFLAAWEFDSFSFIEHFAVNENRRGGNIGSKMLAEFLKLQSKPVVLEVEAVQNEIAKRRINFYKRLGFCENPFGYYQPTMQKGNEQIYLKIMSYKMPLNEAEFDIIKTEIFKKVYKKSLETN